MTPLPPDSTRRYFVDYTVAGHEHTWQVRTEGGLSPLAFGGFLNDFATALGGIMLPTTINQVRTAAPGSNVSVPVVTDQEGRTYGGGSANNIDVPKFINFVGRTSGGRRVRLAVFGISLLDLSWRYTTAEESHIATCVSLLNASVGIGLGVDGIKAVWYPYANVGFNAYWQRAVRS